MADDSESDDRFCAPRNNWELVSLEKPDNVPAEALSSLSGTLEHDHSSDEPCFYTNKFIDMNYFALPSIDSSRDSVMQRSEEVMPQAKTMSLGTEEDVESPPATTLELDWIEPSTPIRSCVIGTSEDDESSSRSCSGDSREGSTDHLVREKDAITSTGHDRDPYVGDYTPVLRDVPMDAIQESQVELSGGLNDASSGGGGDEAPWRRRLGAWLSEAGRASTFCSIALAAAVIGLVLAGSGWQHIRLRCQKFRCRFFPKGKVINKANFINLAANCLCTKAKITVCFL
eukprot:c22436_g1_i1 orf=622-1479(-)